MAKTLKLAVPDEVAGTPFEKDYLETAQQIIKEQTVIKLYREHKISTGTGAKMLGMSIYDFIQFLGLHQVSIFDFSDQSLLSDVDVAVKAARLNQREKL